ncbi:hypothetical protein CR513_26547, partial [Mucuna pruriens]
MFKSTRFGNASETGITSFIKSLTRITHVEPWWDSFCRFFNVPTERAKIYSGVILFRLDTETMDSGKALRHYPSWIEASTTLLIKVLAKQANKLNEKALCLRANLEAVIYRFEEPKKKKWLCGNWGKSNVEVVGPGSDALVEKFKFQMSDYKNSVTSRLFFLDLAPDASDYSNPFASLHTFGKQLIEFSQ